MPRRSFRTPWGFTDILEILGLSGDSSSGNLSKGGLGVELKKLVQKFCRADNHMTNTKISSLKTNL
jgi:hypothetical protein